jgi:hypothetical protein
MNQGKQEQVKIDINFIKSLHQDLGTIHIVLTSGGLPETIKVNDLDYIEKTCEILEKMVAFIKKNQRNYEQRKS